MFVPRYFDVVVKYLAIGHSVEDNWGAPAMLVRLYNASLILSNGEEYATAGSMLVGIVEAHVKRFGRGRSRYTANQGSARIGAKKGTEIGRSKGVA